MQMSDLSPNINGQTGLVSIVRLKNRVDSYLDGERKHGTAIFERPVI